MIAKWNHYICERCKGRTIAMHEADGVTPFMVRCRAKVGCQGWAYSQNYQVSQAEDQKPDIIWYRPETEDAARAAIAETTDPMHHGSVLEHWRMGGALMRELPRVIH